MLDAVHELWKTAEALCFPGVLVQDIQVLGEIHGRLFSIREEEEYAQRGGARYAGNVAVTNTRVLPMEVHAENKEDEEEYGGPTDAAQRGEEMMHRTRNRPSCSVPLSSPGCASGLPGVSNGVETRRRSCSTRGKLSQFSLLLRWRIHQIADSILRVAGGILPLVRLFYPSAVPKSVCRSSLLISSSSDACTSRMGRPPFQRCGPERVTAMAFHPYRPLLAIAIDEGGSGSQARVQVVDVVKSSFAAPLSLSCVLTHAFQKRVEVLAWKPFSEDVLAVGCESGVLLWSLEAGEKVSSSSSQNVAGGGCAPGLEKYDVERPFEERFPTFRSPASPSSSSVPLDSSTFSSRGRSSRSACCVFYPFCSPGIPVTSLAFSNQTGRFLACGSRFYTLLSLVDVTAPPCDEHRRIKWTPSLDGGSEGVQFAAMTDAFVLSLTCGHASVTVTPMRLPGSGRVGSAVDEDGGVCVVSSSKRIATPFPVVAAKPAMGVMNGEDIYYYFLQLWGMEGLVLARLELSQTSLHVVSLISTRVERGIGGLVRTFACSKRRLWIATETGHLLVMYYHRQHYWTERGGYIGVGRTDSGHVVLIPIAAATMDVSHLDSFEGFAPGSLAAIIEQSHLLHFMPCYHS